MYIVYCVMYYKSYYSGSGERRKWYRELSLKVLKLKPYNKLIKPGFFKSSYFMNKNKILFFSVSFWEKREVEKQRETQNDPLKCLDPNL